MPDRIIPHGAPNLLHAKYGLDVDGIVTRIKSFAGDYSARSAPQAARRGGFEP